MDFVYMTHPDTKGTSKAPRQAFDSHWAAKGWVEVDAPQDEVDHPLETDPVETPADPIEDTDEEIAVDDGVFPPE